MQILILVTPDFNLSATMGFIDPFRAANYLEGEALFSWTIVSLDGGLCRASNGMSLETMPVAEARDKYGLVMVSSSWAPERYFQPKLLSVLRRMAANGSAMAGLDTGAFLLAKAGLLSGRKATVHYEHIDAMIEMFSDIEVCEDLFVFDGNRMSCCGGMASTDFALHIIRRSNSDRLANVAARYIFHPSIRRTVRSKTRVLSTPWAIRCPLPCALPSARWSSTWRRRWRSRRFVRASAFRNASSIGCSSALWVSRRRSITATFGWTGLAGW